jgi:hypothetical protein
LKIRLQVGGVLGEQFAIVRHAVADQRQPFACRGREIASRVGGGFVGGKMPALRFAMRAGQGSGTFNASRMRPRIFSRSLILI